MGNLSAARFSYEGPGWGYAMDGDAVTVSVRHRDGEVAADQAWVGTSAGLLASAAPWRTFRWYRGQKGYAGTYWAATTQDHLIYEWLELAWLLLADFDPSVHGIVAQPFLLKAVVDGQVNRVTQRITDLGIDSLFLRVDGRTGPSARRRTHPLAKHLAALRQTVRDRPVALIGDAVDDIRAAVANQVQPVP